MIIVECLIVKFILNAKTGRKYLIFAAKFADENLVVARSGRWISTFPVPRPIRALAA